jgi:hypothetical protein
MANVVFAIVCFLIGAVFTVIVLVWTDNGIKKALESRNSMARYPSCDHLNIAIDALLGMHADEDVRFAIEEICNAINKAEGYYTNRVANLLSMYGFGGYVTKERVL